MYEKLRSVITQSGLWNGTRESTHAFLLSPSVFEITREQEHELRELGIAIRECQFGLSHIAVIAHDSSLNYRGAWRMVRRVCCAGVPKIYQGFQQRDIRSIPALLKVDLMVDATGAFKIGEIDGHNKHGLGYSTLCVLLRDALYPEATKLPGVVKVLSDEIRRLGHSSLKLLYADQERFYLPEFEIARTEFQNNGIECIVASEMEVDAGFVSSGLFLDLPFMYKRKDLYDSIIAGYNRGEVSFIIPPKPFLGSKGVLGLLRNDCNDSHLEALLRSFIAPSSLELVRKYIPETFLVGKEALGIDEITSKISSKRYVLKEAISSGMKGVYFSDEPDFSKVLEGATKSLMHWVLQEEVVNQSQTFSWFDSQQEVRTASDWLMRVTIQYVQRSVGDIIVTARRGDKAVHGGKDAIFIGATIC